MTIDNAPERVAAAKQYAADHGLIYLPCFLKEPSGDYSPLAIDATDAIKALQKHRLVPHDTLQKWWLGVPSRELRLSLCTTCHCAPIANAEGTCWRCETRPWVCA